MSEPPGRTGRSTRLGRRELLRAAGAAGVLFPFLGRRAAAAPPTPRLVLLMQSNGTLQSAFWPAPASLVSPILEPITRHAQLAGKLTVVKGLRNDVGGAGNGHDQGFCGLYSGYASAGDFNDPWGSGVSLDQHLRAKLAFAEPFPTLNCGVLASDTPPFKAHRRSFSYTAARQQVPVEFDVYRLYARFFGLGAGAAPGEDPAAAARLRLRRKRSVLDLARRDLQALAPRLPALDRGKLAQHETALRELERRLGATLGQGADAPPQCQRARAPEEALDVRAEDNVPRLVPLTFDFMALALSCQLTRIVTFQFGHGGEKWYFRWLGIGENSHDDIAHRDNGLDPVVSAKLLTINRWYAEQVAHLALAMDRYGGDPGGTLLDQSLVVWGNEIATGPHGMADLPMALLGGGAGRLRRPGRLVDAGPQDYRRLGTSLLHLMGLPAAGFGEAPDCGPLQDLDIV